MAFNEDEPRDDHGMWTAEMHVDRAKELRAEADRHGNNAIGNDLRTKAALHEQQAVAKAPRDAQLAQMKATRPGHTFEKPRYLAEKTTINTYMAEAPMRPLDTQTRTALMKTNSIGLGGARASFDKTVSVDPRSILTNQSIVSPAIVAKYLPVGGGGKTPLVVRFGDKLIVSDGNHRVAAAILRGDTSMTVSVRDHVARRR